MGGFMTDEEKVQMQNTMRTGLLTAYPKIYSGIDYSQEIFYNALSVAQSYGFTFAPEQFVANMAVEIEGRYKAVSSLLRSKLSKTKKTLVIEFAVGLSPRRLEFAQVDYLESDFEPMVKMKKQIYKRMGFQKFEKGLFSVDLANTKQLNSFLTKKANIENYDQIILITEGLFWYLNKEIITNMTNAFSAILQNKNWLWISADCPTQDRIEEEYRNVISKSANVKREKTFSDFEDFSTFFENLNFEIIRKKIVDCVKAKDIHSASLFSISTIEATNRLSKYTDMAIISPKKK